jgi:hypothetical protein
MKSRPERPYPSATFAGTELAAGNEMQATAEEERWVEVRHRLLAGGGESRRARRASNDSEVIMPSSLNPTSGPVRWA